MDIKPWCMPGLGYEHIFSDLPGWYWLAIEEGTPEEYLSMLMWE